MRGVVGAQQGVLLLQLLQQPALRAPKHRARVKSLVVGDTDGCDRLVSAAEPEKDHHQTEYSPRCGAVRPLNSSGWSPGMR